LKNKAHLCPLKPISDQSLRQCDRTECMLWVKIVKDAPNPSYRFVYRGCGLVAHIPWQPEKLEG